MAVIRSREVAAKQGFLSYYTILNSDAKVSVCYRHSGRSSIVKRGSTVSPTLRMLAAGI